MEEGKISSAPPPMHPDPLFIVYKGRSGSTFLADLLSKHPHVGLAPESRFVLNLLQWSGDGQRPVTEASLAEVLDVLYQEVKFSTWGLSQEEVREHVADRLPLSTAEFARSVIRCYCQRHYANPTVWGLKKSGHLYKIPTLRRLFPRAQFLHILRDGRAVFASAKRARHSETGEPFEDDPEDSALAWINVAKTFERVRGEPYACEVQYEDLIMHPAPTLKRLLQFLDVGFSREVITWMLQPHETDYVPESQAHLHEKVGRAPDPSRVHGWKEELSHAETKAFERIGGKMLEKKGYERVYPPGTMEVMYGRLVRAKDWTGRAVYELRKKVQLRTRMRALYEKLSDENRSV